ncbi:uncharacterized protein M437DRAFT_76893 [Aureobasidium melanogenum CBS 110374]|uniref:CBM-cenC domain-containing protein n=1 Tax=Aureobasidium melanogenum (strain CBS 110374) TaxID=1043003 RepID=A0A074VK63_AURM1|nr:uncharacterized protein M437DRAFT_76893 [Aureobasidium melanogenum CBS 110374]KEQ60928.1 hypothetical protein M437DRAFT_76893 [Aureobasidium melanogenum CBS 110374]
MYIPSAQSLFCLSLLALPYASAIPLNENLQPRAATTCNNNDIKTVNSSNKQPVAYCKSWLATKQSKSTVKGLTVAQISNACKCVEASASSSSAAAAKKTTSSTKKPSSTKKVTSSTTKKATSSTKITTSIKSTLKEAPISTRASSATKSSTSTKKTSTSSKQSTTSKQSTSSKSSTSQKSTATSTSVASKKSTWTSVSTKQSSSSSSKTSSMPSSTIKSSSSSFTSSTSAQSHLSSSASSATSSVSSTTFSAVAIPMDAVTGVVTNQKAPTGVSTRSSSSIQTSSSTVASSATTAASANTKDLSNGSNVIANGIFSQGSTTGWHGARAFGTKFAVASLAGDSNYEALVNGQLYQNLSADVYLNYPSGLPAGVACVVKYSLGSDSIILKQYGVASTSGAVLSDSASGTLLQAFTGRFQIDTYCNSASSSAASFALGFGNIQLLVADAGSATSTAATANAAVTTSTSTPSSTTSSAASASTTGANMLTNGDFGTGDFSGWALYRLGDPTFAIQGNPNAYVSVITFPAGGDSNSQAALLQQPANATSGTTYTASMGLLLNYPSGLANDGSSCSVQVYFVDSNGFGISFAQTTYTYGDAAYQSITGSGSVNNGFSGVFDIMIRCYGGAQAIAAGVEDVQLYVS